MTTAYMIKDVAELSGFSAATLRYYEEIGLLPPSARTPAGYRQYDDETLQRLAFIGRAKQLGCSLDEIADLTVAWDGGRCGPVQDRLRAVVADKLEQARQQISELTTLTAELRRAAATLEMHRPDGPCNEMCGCTTANAADGASRHLSVTTKPSTDVEIACTLAPHSMDARVDEWRSLLDHATRRDAIVGGTRVTFADEVPLDDLMRLTAAEQDCCHFFDFSITVDRRGIGLEVRAPAEALPIVLSLFGPVG
ncbi:MAG: MerR family transcriptional regulator [Ilumatobacteraceae bacterium]